MGTIDVVAASATDPGDRPDNQDRVAVLRGGRVCLVADGMGGEVGGAVASTVATQSVEAAISSGELGPDLDNHSLLAALHGRAIEANGDIVGRARQEPALTGMGTTLTLVVIARQDAFYVHVGDSRLYHWREGTTRQLTRDDTSAQELIEQGHLAPEEAPGHPASSVLLKYLGTTRGLAPSTGREPLCSGDRLLICSDGLHDVLPASRLHEMLGLDVSADKQSRQLVAAARDTKQRNLDNISAVILHLG